MSQNSKQEGKDVENKVEPSSSHLRLSVSIPDSLKELSISDLRTPLHTLAVLSTSSALQHVEEGEERLTIKELQQQFPETIESPASSTSSSISWSSSCKKDNRIIDSVKSYNRKSKSLSTLSDRFIKHYEDNEVSRQPDTQFEIKLDDAAKSLGVEKRRIYDIVNVLESVEIVKKKAVSLYLWQGCQNLSTTLCTLRQSGLQNGTFIHSILEVEELKDNCHIKTIVSNSISPGGKMDNPKVENDSKKKETSLLTLSQRFVQLFLVTQMHIIPHDIAVSVLIGSQGNESNSRTKTRRLYDIANILSSIQLVEKSYSSADSKKPSFKWIGAKLSNFLAPLSPSIKAHEEPISLLPNQETPVNRMVCGSTLVEADVPISMPLKKRKRQEEEEKCSSASNDNNYCAISKTEPWLVSSDDNSRPVKPFERLSQQTKTGLHFQFHSPQAKKRNIEPSPPTREPLQPLSFSFANKKLPVKPRSNQIATKTSMNTVTPVVQKETISLRKPITALSVSNSPHEPMKPIIVPLLVPIPMHPLLRFNQLPGVVAQYQFQPNASPSNLQPSTERKDK